MHFELNAIIYGLYNYALKLFEKIEFNRILILCLKKRGYNL